MKNGTKKMKAGGKTTGKTKKFAVGGFAPFMPGPGAGGIGGGGGGATGSVKQISKAAKQAASQLGQAGAAIGGGGNTIPIPSPIPSPLDPGPGGGYVPEQPAMGPVYYAKGGKVRGAGIATQGVRPAKMR